MSDTPNTTNDYQNKLARIFELRGILAGQDANRRELIDLEKELDSVINPRAAKAPKVARKARTRKVVTPPVEAEKVPLEPFTPVGYN